MDRHEPEVARQVLFELLVPGLDKGGLEVALDRLFTTQDPHALAAGLDQLQATLLQASRSLALAMDRLGIADAPRALIDDLGRGGIRPYAHILIRRAGLGRSACLVAAVGFACEQLSVELAPRQARTLPATEHLRLRALRIDRGPFSEIAVPRVAERLVFSGWRPSPNLLLTRRELYEAAMRLPHVSAISADDVEAASLTYGPFFDQVPGGDS